jgi:glycyl-tRNA synthetase
MFVNFRNVIDTTRLKLPFGLAQVGKAFRNEITPGNFLFRTREFEQMEIQMFLTPELSDTWFAKFQEMSREFWTQRLGINKDNLRNRDHA